MDVEETQPSVPPLGKRDLKLPMYKNPGQPEHYRLSATRLEGTKRQSPKTLVVSGTFQLPAISPAALY